MSSKFKVGQIVAAETPFHKEPQIFRIGFVYEGENSAGDNFYWYTENETDKPPFFTEDVLRELTSTEKEEYEKNSHTRRE